jgi:VWFA-related protein
MFALFAPCAPAQQGPNRPASPSRPSVSPVPEPVVRRPRQPQTRPTPRPTPAPTTQAQDGTHAPQDEQGDEDDVVRITTNLVQMDVVVVDKKGNQVTDLRAEDFEVYEDKRPQQITNFSYVLNETAPRAAAPDDSSRNPLDKLAPPAPPRRLRPEQVRRTMALVVDDLGLSFGSTDAVRDALRKFVNEQMQPNDLVAIIRTSAGMGALQQFTSDKRQLHAAIDRVRWYPGGRGGVSTFAPLNGTLTTDGPEIQIEERTVGLGSRSDDDADGRVENFREDLFAVGTLGAVNFVVRGMRELPGRKSVTLFSDGFSLRTSERGPSSERVFQALRQLTELANRASVVVYSIDARGLVVPGLSAEDNTSGMTIEDIESVQAGRSFEIFDSQSGLDYLARETGGFLIKNSNDLARGVRRIVEDQRGYYLIGYRPESQVFDRRYHNFAVRVKRPGLLVRTRTGFFGVRDEESRPLRRTREEQLLGALISPFASGGVRLRLTAIFGNTEQSGSFMTSLMHINGNDLKFTKQPDGTYQTVIDVAGVTYSDNGRVVDSRDQTGTLKMNEEAYQKAQRDGLVYSFVVPVKKAGAYQLRMAVRDTATARTGSASQFIEVPDLKKDRLVLSGIVVSGLKGNSNGNSAATSSPASAGEENGRAANAPAAGKDDTAASHASPAVRRFRSNSNLTFAYAIYNARLDRQARRPQLTAQARLFRDGVAVFNGPVTPLNFASLPDPKRIDLGGSLNLGAGLPPGEYILQIVVTDALAKEKHRTATQWTDFEIVR